MDRQRRPGLRRNVGAHPARPGGGRGPRRDRRASRVHERAVAGVVAVASRRAAAQARRPHRGERRVARARRDEGQRQAAAPSSSCRCATWRITTITTAASPTRWRARSSPPTSRASSTTRSTSRSAWSSCIMPWNSPLPLTSLKLAPALAAGNTVVLKPSEFTSASLLEFVKLVEAAGFPPGVVNVVTGYGAEIGDALISHPRVDRIAFTGGPEAGRMINEKAARHMKRVTMELGGKSPNIVFDDANLDEAVKGVVAGHLRGVRPVVRRGFAAARAELDPRRVRRASSWRSSRDVRFGHPSDPATQIAPDLDATAAREDQVVRGDRQGGRRRARRAAASRRASPDGPNGLFFKPTIFVDVDNDMRIAQEEVFGPVLVGDPLRRRRRRGAHRQRHPVRTRGGRVDAVAARAPSRWPTAFARARCGSTTTA